MREIQIEDRRDFLCLGFDLLQTNKMIFLYYRDMSFVARNIWGKVEHIVKYLIE